METGKNITIAVVDDHPILRKGMVEQFSEESGFQVTMKAEHGLDMLNQLKEGAIIPDIAIIDLKMPVMDGFSLADALKDNYPTIRMLVVSAYDSEFDKSTMIAKGIRGYLRKDCDPNIYKEAVEAIYNTGYYYSDSANELVFKLLKSKNLKSLQIPPREMEFLKLCCHTDLRYDQIAKKMGISISTLEGCRKRLFSRLKISTRLAIVEFAHNSGIDKADY